MKRFSRFYLVGLVGLLFQPWLDDLHAAEPGRPAVRLESTYVQSLLEELRTNHPGLAATRSREDAARANAAAVRQWEDPMARMGGMIAREPMRAEDGDLVYGLEQKLPLFGRPAARRSVAQAEAAVAGAEVSSRFEELRRDLLRALYEMALTEERLLLLQEDSSWANSLRSTAAAQYEAGGGSQPNVLRAEAEFARAQTALEILRQHREHQWILVLRLLNPKAPRPMPALRLPEVAPPIALTDALLRHALQEAPQLQLLRRTEMAADAAVTVTKKARLPEAAVGLEGRNYTGDASFRQGMLTLSLSLPWGNRSRYEADLRREKARARAAGLEIKDYELALHERLHEFVLQAETARLEAQLNLRDVAPRAEQALASLDASWRTGRANLTELLDTRRLIVGARLSALIAVARQHEALAELGLHAGLATPEEVIAAATPPSTSRTNSIPSVSQP